MELINNWNMQTQTWLKYYVLARLVDRSKPRGTLQVLPLLATFVISALWHGFFFGFYALFLGLALLYVTWTTVSKVRVAQQVRALIPDSVFKVLSWLACEIAIPFFGMPFVFKTFARANNMWNGLNYFGLWLFPALILLASVLPQAKRAAKRTAAPAPEKASKALPAAEIVSNP